ncbi:MAG: O-antigen ligase family protein [Terriglobales bacterium]
MERYGGALATLVIWALALVLILPRDLDFVGRGMYSGGDTTTRMVWLGALAIPLGLLASRSSRAVTIARWLNPCLWLLLLLAVASITWSIAPSYTILRSIRFLTVVLACLSFALFGWKPQRLQAFLRLYLTLVCVISILFAVYYPEGGIHHVGGRELINSWKGVTTGKNILGSLAGVCVLVWLHGWMTHQVKLILAVFGIAVGIICLAGSRSQTSIMAAVFAVMFMLLLIRTPGTLRRSTPYLVGAFATAILIYALAVLRIVPGLQGVLAPIEMLTGKDLSFSGRTNIWYVLTQHIHLSPWLGSGYGAYWVGEDAIWSPSHLMLQLLWFYPTEGHNGYLDLINDLGAVGGLLLLGYFVRYIRDGLRVMRIDRAQGALYLTMLFRGFIADMSESHWMNALSIDFLIMTLATAAMARTLLQAHLDRSARVTTAARDARLRAAEGVLARVQGLRARPN